MICEIAGWKKPSKAMDAIRLMGRESFDDWNSFAGGMEWDSPHRTVPFGSRNSLTVYLRVRSKPTTKGIQPANLHACAYASD